MLVMDDPNISNAEFIMVHAAIDRIMDLSRSGGKIRVFLSESKTLWNLRQKPLYLTIAQKNLALKIINNIYARHKDLYRILTPATKSKQAVEDSPELLRLQLSQANSDLIDSLRQSIAS